ncbi:Transcription factor ZEB2 [Lasiodiplodia hormozganensis]|uniref:Transcription factor ZEB2 n=1 Tax=Lasiodiplodia hormozganensis TaxID=869390 RepID=A0AA39XQN7_9PEZI|nr:Transcription factor ZEB2 [Lasiodiplodia hormozganensis]
MPQPFTICFEDASTKRQRQNRIAQRKHRSRDRARQMKGGRDVPENPSLMQHDSPPRNYVLSGSMPLETQPQTAAEGVDGTTGIADAAPEQTGVLTPSSDPFGPVCANTGAVQYGGVPADWFPSTTQTSSYMQLDQHGSQQPPPPPAVGPYDDNNYILPYSLQPDPPAGAHHSFQSVEERMEALVEFSRSMGFTTFDDAVTTYYTAQFKARTRIEMEQRCSRSRQLPGVLALLTASAQRWTSLQSHAYRCEIVKAAENIYADEMARLEGLIGPLQMHGGGTGLAALRNCPDELQGILEDHAPNLWLLLVELAKSRTLESNCTVLSIAASLLNLRLLQRDTGTKSRSR